MINLIFSLILIVTFTTFTGCMMIGMHGGGDMGMEHDGTHKEEARQQKIIVKESVINGLKIIAEFPPYDLGNELVYNISVYDTRDNLFIPDASISLIVTTDNNMGEDSHPEHGKMLEMKFYPDEINKGTYIFRPSITNPDTYKFIFILERIGNSEIDPPIEVEQTIQILRRMDQHSEDVDNTTGFSISPIILISAGAMAVLMLFMFR